MYKNFISSVGKLIRKSSLIFATFILMLTPTGRVFALSQQDLQFFSQNNILFYDPDACESNDNQTCVSATGDQITWIGDSYSIGAQSIIEAKFPGITFGGSVDDANSTIQGCKFVGKDTTCNANPTNPSALDVLKKIVDAGDLKPYLVMAVGTNGGWTNDHVTRFKDVMAKSTNTKVVFVNSRIPNDNYDSSNSLLKSLTDSDDNYSLADWASVYQDSYFASNSIHPTSNGGYEKWVDIIAEAMPKNCTANDVLLPGSNISEKVWNWLIKYFKEQGFNDKDIPAIVSGMMGNFWVESGVNPFMVGSNGSYVGLHMLANIYGGSDYMNEVNAAIGKNYFKFYGWWSDEFKADTDLKNAGATIEEIDTAINTNLNAITSQYYWTEFLNGLRTWGVADTPRGYADLFLVTMERAVNGESPIEDPGVKVHYNGYYQGASARRDKAQYFYDKYAKSSAINPNFSSSSVFNSSLTGDNKNYAGAQVFSDEQMALIEKGKPFYKSAAAQYNIPWQLFAIIHNAESGFSWTNPGNGQGVYQLYGYTKGGSGANAFPGGVNLSDAEFQRQTNLAADELSEKIKRLNIDITTDNGVKELLFAYNGKANTYIQKALSMGFSQAEANIGEGSSYVMNRYDARRDPDSGQMDSHWPGRFVKDGVYDSSSISHHFGTFVQYQALGGGNGNIAGNSCRTGINYGDLIGYVKKFVWPDFKGNGFLTPMPDYKEAYDRRVREGKYVGSHSTYGDCGGFVTTILNESGFAPEYNYGGIVANGASNVTGGQLKYMLAHPDEWVLVNPSWGVAIPDESVLSPGDVAVSRCSSTTTCGHTYLYVGEIPGFNSHIASASWDDRVPMAGTEAIVANGVNWFHRIKR